MKSKKNLHQLIKSLNQSEKRYFKRFASLHIKGKENIYVKLFDFINKQHQYDENKIIEKFPGKNLPWLAKEKYYLYHFILKCLRNYNSGSRGSISAQLKDILTDVENLYEKALFEQCVKLLAHSKKIAYKYGKDLHLLEIFKWEKKLFYSGKKEIYLKKILEEEKQILNKRKNIHEYDNLLAEVLELTKLEGMVRNGNELDKIDKIIAHPLLSDENKACSFDAKLRFYNVYSIYYQAKGDFLNNYKVCGRWVKLLEAHPERIGEAPFKYITALDNYLLSYNMFKEAGEFLYYVSMLELFPNHYMKSCFNKVTARVESMISIRVYSHLLKFYNYRGDFEKSIEKIPVVEALFKRLKGKLDKKHELSLILLIANAYFAVNVYDKALNWLEKILKDADVDLREDIHSFAMILNLIIHYEKHQEDMPEYLVQSTYRYLAKRKPRYAFEPVVLKFFRTKVFKSWDNKKLIEAFKELRENLIEVIKDPFERKALERFDFICWLESKIEDKPMAEIVKNKSK